MIICENCAMHSRSYVQAIFTNRHENIPRPQRGWSLIAHRQRQASLKVDKHFAALAFLVSMLLIINIILRNLRGKTLNYLRSDLRLPRNLFFLIKPSY